MPRNASYPSKEYNERIAAIVEKTKRTFHENPEQARKSADATLKRMGLIENGKIKKQIVTTEYRVQ